MLIELTTEHLVDSRLNMKEKLVIWGASIHAQVVADIIRIAGKYEVVGFLDDLQPERYGQEFCGARVLGGRLVSFAKAEQCDLVWHPFRYETPQGAWKVRNAEEFAWSQVTISSVLYRSWFTKLQFDIGAHLLMEPGDWNRFRRFKYVGAICRRYPERLLKHYREFNPNRAQYDQGHLGLVTSSLYEKPQPLGDLYALTREISQGVLPESGQTHRECTSYRCTIVARRLHKHVACP